MQTRTLGSDGLEVSAQGLGCMGMSEFYGTADEDEAVATIHRALELGVMLPRHGRHVRPVHQREARRRARSPTAATRSCSPRSSATSAARTASFLGVNGKPGLRAHGLRRVAAAARRRPHRPLLPAPRRQDGPDRGDRRRDGGARRGGQGPPPRALGGLAGHDPARARRPPDHGAADRVLAVDARPRGRGAADRARARHRLRRLLPARPRLPLGRDHEARRPRRGRLPPPQPALPARELRHEPRARRRASREIADEKDVTPGQLALAWLLHQTQGDRTSSRSRAPSASATSRRTPRRRRSSSAGTTSRASTTPRPRASPPASATRTCRASIARRCGA